MAVTMSEKKIKHKNPGLMEQLSDLTPAQLAEVAARVQFLRGGSSTPPAQSSGDDLEQMVHNAFNAETAKAGCPIALPFPVLAKLPYFRKYRDGVVGLKVFIDGCLKPKTRVEMLMCVRRLVRLMVIYCGERNLPANHKILTDMLAKINEVVEDQFPGYIDAGMVHVITGKGLTTPDEG